MEQLTLAGCDEWIPKPKPSWQPNPHLVSKIQSYILGFFQNGKKLFAKVRTIAQRFGVSVRTMHRYLRHLERVIGLQTAKRTPRHAIRQLQTDQPEAKPAGTSVGTCIEVKSEVLRPRSDLELSECGNDFQAAVERYWRKFMPPPVVLFRRIGKSKFKTRMQRIDEAFERATAE